jgi:hypothetical protein
LNAAATKVLSSATASNRFARASAHSRGILLLARARACWGVTLSRRR